jgi:hypothetical protein
MVGMQAKKATWIYQLKITLHEIRPPIFRQVQVPGRVRLCCLHDVFQVVMGWTNSHLHQFEKDGAYYAVPDDEAHGIDIIDEDSVSLDNVLCAEGDSMLYLYDFGDSWRHDVILEKKLPADGAAMRPVCIAGERRCPPEEVGGVPGYDHFLDVIFNPAHEEYEQLVAWFGGRFQPEEFDLAAVNRRLSRMRWPVRCYR